MASASKETLSLVKPENIEYQWVDLATGLRSRVGCPSAAQLPFIEGTRLRGSSSCQIKR